MIRKFEISDEDRNASLSLSFHRSVYIKLKRDHPEHAMLSKLVS